MKTTICNAFCYSGYTWRVFCNNKFAGYVVAMSEYDAYNKACNKYGNYIWIERVTG